MTEPEVAHVPMRERLWHNDRAGEVGHRVM